MESPGSSAEPQDADTIAVLRLQTSEMDNEAMATLDRELIRLAREDPGRLARASTGALFGSDVLLQVAAACVLGRAAEEADPDLVVQIETTLVVYAADVRDDALMEAVATALLHVWGRSDDETFAVEQRHATAMGRPPRGSPARVR